MQKPARKQGLNTNADESLESLTHCLRSLPPLAEKILHECSAFGGEDA